MVVPGPPLSLVASRKLDLPEIVDMRVLARRTNLWLPPNWRLVDDESGVKADQTVSWSQRLFGPLGRPIGSWPFDPLDADDWSDLRGRWPSVISNWSCAGRIVPAIELADRFDDFWRRCRDGDLGPIACFRSAKNLSAVGARVCLIGRSAVLGRCEHLCKDESRAPSTAISDKTAQFSTTPT